jgi:hypothetical protein
LTAIEEAAQERRTPEASMLALVLITLAAPVPKPAPAPPKPVVGKAFAVAPVTTALHRRLIFASGPDSAAVVVVNGSALFPDGKSIDPEALDLDGLRKALSAYRPSKDVAVHFAVHYSGPVSPPAKAVNLLHWGLEGLARDVGFGRAKAMGTYHQDGRFDWEKFVAPLREAKGGDTDEPAAGDERARAYPVRTPLSRLLAGPADCIVDVRAPLDPVQGTWLTPEGEKSVRAAITELKLPAAASARFFFNVKSRDDRTTEQIRGLSNQLAAPHGLAVASYIY